MDGDGGGADGAHLEKWGGLGSMDLRGRRAKLRATMVDAVSIICALRSSRQGAGLVLPV